MALVYLELGNMATWTYSASHDELIMADGRRVSGREWAKLRFDYTLTHEQLCNMSDRMLAILIDSARKTSTAIPRTVPEEARPIVERMNMPKPPTIEQVMAASAQIPRTPKLTRAEAIEIDRGPRFVVEEEEAPSVRWSLLEYD